MTYDQNKSGQQKPGQGQNQGQKPGQTQKGQIDNKNKGQQGGFQNPNLNKK